VREFLRRLVRRAVKWAGIHPRDPALLKWFPGVSNTASGVAVTETRAFNCAALWAAVRLIAEAKASLPCILYRRVGEGKERAVDHIAYRLLHDAPNSEMTAFTFHEVLQAHALLRGNGYAEIERDVAGTPLALWPLPPDRVRPLRDREGQLWYEVSGGSITRHLRPEYMLHIPGLGFDGTRGYDVLTMARASIGFTLASEEYGARYFGSGVKPSGVLTHPGVLSQTARDNLKQSVEDESGGLDRAHRLMVLEEGMKFDPIGHTPEDAQFLETRKFQTIEIARWFNVPPHMLRDLERATFSNIEHQGIDFVTYSLRPWLIRSEQEYSRKLLSEGERAAHFFEHLVDALLRGDTKTRYEAYSIARNNGFASVNDIRRRENEPAVSVPEADDYLRPVNAVSMGTGVTSPDTLLKIVESVEAGTLSASAGRAVLSASFPSLALERIVAMIPLEVPSGTGTPVNPPATNPPPNGGGQAAA